MTPIVITIPWWSVVTAMLVAVLAILSRRKVTESWDIVSAQIPFAGLGKVEIRPNNDDIQIAHRAWVELATRKVGVEVDPADDVIVEVYDSWYEVFCRLRELLKDCSASRLRSSDSTRKLVATIVTVLNDGMRPHLTTWQARFRRWYDDAIEKAGADESPQEVQRNYPEYEELMKDLRHVQAGLQSYVRLLQSIATGEK